MKNTLLVKFIYIILFSAFFFTCQALLAVVETGSFTKQEAFDYALYGTLFGLTTVFIFPIVAKFANKIFPKQA